MMKKIVAAAAVAMMSASVAMASPAVELSQGKINAGYNYTNYNVKVGGADANHSGNDFYIQGGLSDKFALGFESENVSTAGNDIKTTDLTVQYKLDKNFSLVAGNRHHSVGGYSKDSMLWGLKARTELGKNVDGYAAFQTSSNENEFQVGALVKLSQNLNLDVNYKDHEGKGDMDHLSWKGLGVGLNTSF